VLPLNKVLNWLDKELTEINSEASRLEAELLLAFVLEKERAFIYTVDYLSEKEISKLNYLLGLRKKRIPLAYIIGKKYFYEFELSIKKGVLVPRAETEVLLEVAKRTIEEGNIKTIVEVGVGSGNISVSLACKFKDLKIYACDISPEALKVAMENAQRYEVLNKIDFFLGPFVFPIVFRELDFDLIISNPPYIASWEFPFLQAEVKREPWEALYGGWDGCEFYREIFKVLKRKSNGIAIFELSPFISSKLSNIFKEIFDNVEIEIFKDYLGHDRVIKIKWQK